MKHINLKTILAAVVLASLTIATVPALARSKNQKETILSAIQENQSTVVAASGNIEMAFSPNEGAEHLVRKVIESAKSGDIIRVMAYDYTLDTMTNSLLAAIDRGAKVMMVVDYKANVSDDHRGAARKVLTKLASAGAQVRTIATYPIAHDKVVIVGTRTVETGSMNFTNSGAHRNSENVMVNWDNPALAKVFIGHFERNWEQGIAYR